MELSSDTQISRFALRSGLLRVISAKLSWRERGKNVERAQNLRGNESFPRSLVKTTRSKVALTVLYIGYVITDQIANITHLFCFFFLLLLLFLFAFYVCFFFFFLYFFVLFTLSLYHFLHLWHSKHILTLVMLNKLRCHSLLTFHSLTCQPIRCLDQDCWLIHILNCKQCSFRSVGRSQLIWVYTVCKSRVYTSSVGQRRKWTESKLKSL